MGMEIVINALLLEFGTVALRFVFLQILEWWNARALSGNPTLA